MDVDSDSPSSVSSTDLLSYFDLSSTSFAWREPIFSEIESRRALLNDTLLFDILLTLGGIKEPETRYPPSNPDALQDLLTQINESPAYDGLKKDGLVYYLLKWHKDGRESRFQRERSIPPQFVALADAYWCLDSGADIPRAVSHLSDPRLNRDYASKILQIISQCKDPQPESLIVKYVRTAKPRLEDPEDINTYTLALAHSNLFEAWQYQRTFSESDPTRERLLKKLIQWCVSPNPKPSALTYLLTLPLSAYEQKVLHNYASSPPKDDDLPANAIPILQNLSCVRLIQLGRHAEAVKMHRSFIAASTSVKGKTTATSAQALFQERDEMIQEVYHALPAVERNLLDAELESGGLGTIHQSVPVSKPRPSTSARRDSNAAGAAVDASGDISMSWEEIPRPPLSSSINGSGKQPNSSGSGSNTPLNFSLSAAPKFGGSIFSSSTSTPTLTPTASATQKPIKGLPPPALSATALNLFGASATTMNSSSSNGRKSGGFTPLGTSTSSMGFGKSFGSSAANTSSRPPIIPTSNTNNMSASAGMNDSFGFGASTSSSNLFVSAAKRENAFFKPPSQQNGNGNGFGSGRRSSGGGGGRESTSVSVSLERPSTVHDTTFDDTDMEMEMNGRDSDAEAGLNYSVFGGKKGQDLDLENGSAAISTGSGWDQPSQSLSASRGQGRKSRGNGNSISALSASSSSRVPGSFMDDDDEEEEGDEDEQDEQDARPVRGARRSNRTHTPPTSAQPAPSTRKTRGGSRKSTAPTTSAVSTASRASGSKSKSRQSISAGMKRSVPGSMYDEDEDDDGASSVQSDSNTVHEDDDGLAPLPTRRTARKTRASMVVDEDGAGASKTRRRSSRLSTASSDAATSSRKSGTRASKGETAVSGKSGRRKR
ncbi:hypothetical protein PM082_007522 [Marasmius tenuissimus]|nr:hypothetical protein PM082_007522 [Marasmius tenuissimus]